MGNSLINAPFRQFVALGDIFPGINVRQSRSDDRYRSAAFLGPTMGGGIDAARQPADNCDTLGRQVASIFFSRSPIHRCWRDVFRLSQILG